MISALERLETERPTHRAAARRAERAAVERVLASGMLPGTGGAAFEAEFAEHVAGRPCVAVNSGTSALLLGLLAVGIGAGDEVIVPSFSFAATANAVALTGATPVFADIEPDHYCLDPDAVAAAIGPRTAAIMPVHLYGHPAAIGPLAALATGDGCCWSRTPRRGHLATWTSARSAPSGRWRRSASTRPRT